MVHRTEEGFVAFCPEVPEANGQGSTREEALEDLSVAITLALDYRLEEALADLPAGAERTTVAVAR